MKKLQAMCKRVENPEAPGSQCELVYSIISEDISDKMGVGICENYGLSVTLGDHEEIVRGITLSADRVNYLANYFYKYDVFPVHLRDLLEDYIGTSL